MEKSRDALRTISEVADWLGVPTHVLRFWESRFSQIRPIKRAGRRRYYRRSDMALLGGIRKLLHDDGMTIRGVQKILREQGVGSVAALAPVYDGQAKENETSTTASDTQDLDAASPIGNYGSKPETRETTETLEHSTKSAADGSKPSSVPRTPTTAGTTVKDETNVAPAQTGESGCRERTDGSQPPGSHAKESASPPHSAETDEGAPDDDIAGSETYDAILDIYNRLLALRSRMVPAPQQSDQDRS